MVPRGDAFRSVKVSDREPKGNGGTSPVFAAMSRQEQEHIREVTQQYGYTIEELAERRIARIHFNALVSVETVNKWSFKPPTDQPFF